MLRRLALALAATAVAVLLLGAPVAAQDGPDDEERLPGTTLEANQRDDGQTSVAPWVIGSGIAALAIIGIGGTVVQRRTR